MSRPQVTVGIPTFNRSGLLRGAIESVLAQTFADFRIIVSDNASEDDTPDVVRGFGDGRIEYLRSAQNIGPLANINRLISLANTEYLVLLPDDDTLYPRHLEDSVAALARYPTAGFVHSAFELIDATSTVYETIHPLRSRRPLTLEHGPQALERMMVAYCPIYFSSVMYRREVIVAAGGLPENAGPSGDMQLWMRIALDWDIAYLSEPLASSRVHDGTITTNVVAEGRNESDTLKLLQASWSEMRKQQRLSFLEAAPLHPRRVSQLRCLAELQFLRESAPNLPWEEALYRGAALARASPRLLLKPSLWRFGAALMGGRWARTRVQTLQRWARSKFGEAHPVGSSSPR